MVIILKLFQHSLDSGHCSPRPEIPVILNCGANLEIILPVSTMEGGPYHATEVGITTERRPPSYNHTESVIPCIIVCVFCHVAVTH